MRRRVDMRRRVTVALLVRLRKRLVCLTQIWQDLGMRQSWVWAVGFTVVFSLTGCGGRDVAAATPDDVLVLEVGGPQPSLRASLLALGRPVKPAHRLSLATVPSVGHAGLEDLLGQPAQAPLGLPTNPVVPGEPEAGPTVPQRRFVAQPPQPLSEWVVVPLPKDQTLVHVARRHLGDGRRWQELLEWNGWSEADARRLRVGQAVKIKRSELR